jgi:hypothetical protein
MERAHAVRSADPIEKMLERARAGEQLLVFIRCILEEHKVAGEGADASAGALDEQLVRRDVPLLRPTAKYLLTACDRLRRGALQDAWRRLSQHRPALEVSAALDEARLWDATMREISLQHGVLHPLAEMVAPLSLGEAELVELGVTCEQLLNGQDLLAS